MTNTLRHRFTAVAISRRRPARNLPAYLPPASLGRMIAHPTSRPDTSHPMRIPLAALGLACTLSLSPASRLTAQGANITLDSAHSSALRWRYIGPVGNRVASVAGVPGD